MKLDDVFGIHEEALRLRGQGSEVLASNLANADTPDTRRATSISRAMLAQEMQPPVRWRPTVVISRPTRRSSRRPRWATDPAALARRQHGGSRARTDRIQCQCDALPNSLRFLDGRIKGPHARHQR